MLRLFNNPIEFVGIFLAFLMAITVHEFAHAWASDRLGDPTARLLGRLSLNPIKHLDPLGTLMILFAPFGWAKPVPYDPFNLRNPKRDAAIISLSGPAANLITATVMALILGLFSGPVFNTNIFGLISATFIRLLIILNVNLAIFNLIPIHPLDGFGVVRGLLPEQYARQWQELEPYGLIFLLFLVFPMFGSASPIGQIISPIINFILSVLLPSTPII